MKRLVFNASDRTQMVDVAVAMLRIVDETAIPIVSKFLAERADKIVGALKKADIQGAHDELKKIADRMREQLKITRCDQATDLDFVSLQLVAGELTDASRELDKVLQSGEVMRS